MLDDDDVAPWLDVAVSDADWVTDAVPEALEVAPWLAVSVSEDDCVRDGVPDTLDVAA